jgi:hypothetical protein
MGTPLLFYLRFGNVDWFAISGTIFLVVACLLFALGLHFQNKTAYHTNVPMERSFADRIGGLWLVACGLGPFFGWLITSFGVTESSWLPVITAIPLIPYAGGKAALIAVPLLIFVTALPILSCFWVLGDMHDGPQTIRVAVLNDGSDGPRICRDLDRGSEFSCDEFRPVLKNQRLKIIWLPHTRRILVKEKITG